MAYNHYSSNGPPPRGYATSTSQSSTSAASALSAFADWAARSMEPDLRVSPVQSYVERCCDPINSRPNLSLNLELADHIKQKQANTPRDAAFAIVQKVNSRHPHISLLALDLLDHLVKNVGYPFHLQVATKEFLNELVKRFPERPPMFPSSTQTKILALINEWKNTLCVDSKRKEDLVHIRDMHRLLTYKGYRFPSLDSRAKGVMNPENNLQSPEELEEEDRAAQAAKLQELIRRGTPRDLEQAQELMKIMSGAEPESRPDYASQTGKELDKVQSRAILLNDMLNNHQPGEKFVKGDGYDQIAGHLRGAQARLQKWVSDGEDGESEQMDRLLLLNDLVNQVCERYEAFKKGDLTATVNIDPSIDPAKGGASAVPTAKITDLISFEDEPAEASSQPAGASAATSASFMDDFASLTFTSDAPAGTGGVATSSASGPAGLPIDLFGPSDGPESNSGSLRTGKATAAHPMGLLQAGTEERLSGSKGGPSTSSPLGDWGALQLPTQSGSSSTRLGEAASSKPEPTARAGPKDPFEDLLA
ncbi:unnamed protein product [Parajaminaea phylloscopi]